MIRKTNLMIMDPCTGEPSTIGSKLIYAAEDFTRTCSKWVRETAHRHEKIDLPVQTSGLNFSESGYGKNELDSLMYMMCNSNDVQNNISGVGLYSTIAKKAHGLHLYPDNFLRAMALFGARKVIKHEWHNNCDEYCAPTPEVESSPEFEEFALDSLVYAMFHSANNCTSVRDLPFKGKKIGVPNNMFWLSPKTVHFIADQHGCHGVYSDSRNPKTIPRAYAERLTPNLIHSMSQEASDLLDAAHALFIESMSSRDVYSAAHPELYLDSWDAGWYQLKDFWKEMYPEEHAKIIKLHRELGDKMRPWVYELGFLRTYEGMGLQTGEARDIFDGLIGGNSSISKDVKTNDFDPCSVCGGSGCAFCHDVGSREEFLFRAITGRE